MYTAADFAFVLELGNDFDFYTRNWNDPNDKRAQFWRRGGVRAMLGSMEAYLNHVRAMSPSMFRMGSAIGWYGPEVQQQLRELLAAVGPIEWHLDEKGKPVKRNRKIGFKVYLKAVTRLFCLLNRIKPATAEKHFALNGWSQMQKAIKIRDRLTHPHASADIVVTDDDTRIISDAWEWYKAMGTELTAEGMSHSEPDQTKDG